MGKEKGNVSTAEENKAIFNRYAEEVGNQQNFEIVDEIFERYIALSYRGHPFPPQA